MDKPTHNFTIICRGSRVQAISHSVEMGKDKVIRLGPINTSTADIISCVIFPFVIYYQTDREMTEIYTYNYTTWHVWTSAEE